MHDLLDKLSRLPVDIIIIGVAMMGGIARYLNTYANGKPFRFGLLCASTFVSGFAGYMVGTAAISLALPQPIIFIMTGTGAFYSEQGMRLLMDYVQKNLV